MRTTGLPGVDCSNVSPTEVWKGLGAALAPCLVVLASLFPHGVLHAQTKYLVWFDEFGGTTIDRSTWSFGSGPSNDNVHYYTDRPENAQLVDGKLRISALKESYAGYSYTSALLHTKGAISWRRGRVEARIKLPGSPGFVPAFWMMPADDMYGWWPCSGEIDIMEHPTTEPDKIYGSAHARSYSYFTGSAPRSKSVTIPDAESAFHVYAIEWTAEQVDFSVDQTKYFTVTNDHAGPGSWPFDQPFYVILNLAVGGGWVGNPGPSTVFPAVMEIDYVRVYQTLDDITITGPDFLPTSAQGVSYAVPFFGGATYVWSVPSTAQIASGQGTNKITLNWAKAGGVLSVETRMGGTVAASTCSVVVSGNLLRNPGFEKGVKYWNKILAYPATGAYDIDSVASESGKHWFKGIVTAPGANPWDAQVTQQGFNVKSGRQYEGRFRAKADRNGAQVNAAVINAQTYYRYGGATLTLTDEWKEYSFRMTSSQNAPGSFNIDLGIQAGTYYLDDLSFVDLSTVTGLDEGDDRTVPGAYVLVDAYPNPCNPSTTIRYSLPSRSRVSLAVFDAAGRLVANLVSGDQESGYHQILFDASERASGVYLYRLQARPLDSATGRDPRSGAGDFVQTKKLMVLK